MLDNSPLGGYLVQSIQEVAPTSPEFRGPWFIGSDLILKAKDWIEGTETEIETIEAVKKYFAKVPVPNII